MHGYGLLLLARHHRLEPGDLVLERFAADIDANLLDGGP
jgi:hypothetical protein